MRAKRRLYTSQQIDAFMGKWLSSQKNRDDFCNLLSNYGKWANEEVKKKAMYRVRLMGIQEGLLIVRDSFVRYDKKKKRFVPDKRATKKSIIDRVKKETRKIVEELANSGIV